MSSEYSNDEVERLLKAPLILAAQHKRELLPVIGAGLSLPLGLPAWKTLIDKLSSISGIAPTGGEDASQLLERVRSASPARYYDNIRALLAEPEIRTTRALQALTTSGVGVIATLNLDYSVETAFELAGKSLKPRRVRYNAAAIEPDSESPQLIKLHGSLEHDETWVMAEGDYNSWYYSDFPKLRKWWENIEWRPFFIGCGMEDHDIKAIVRGLSHRRQRSGFMVLLLEQARKHEAELRRMGMSPIAVTSFDSVCEVIDEVFGCEPLLIEERRQWLNSKRHIRIGAAVLECSDQSGREEEICREMTASMVEVQTKNPVAGLSGGRREGKSAADGMQAINALAGLPDGWRWFQAMAKALWTYADVYPSRLIGSLCRSPEKAKAFWPKVLAHLDDERKKEAERIIRTEFDSVERFSLKSRKVLANVLARDLEQHEAIFIPPAITRIEYGVTLDVMTFHLTVCQVEKLLGKKRTDQPNPIKPHVLQSPEQLSEIVYALNAETPGFRWRLPTVKEWRTIARQETAWPWGDEPPQPGRHAHLKYVSPVSGKDPVLRPVPGIPQGGPTEVGLFLPGRSRGGLFDLIGNVYDLVWTAELADYPKWNTLLEKMLASWDFGSEGQSTHRQPRLIQFKEHFKLAGGAFTSSYIDGSKSKLEDMSEVGSIFAGNIGLRFVREKSTS